MRNDSTLTRRLVASGSARPVTRTRQRRPAGLELERLETRCVLSNAVLGSGGANDAAFIRALYGHVLGRESAPQETPAWVSVLASSSGKPVAEGFLWSPERRGSQVDGYYERFLNRPASPQERAAWVARFDAGAVEQIVMLTFLASEEYQQLHASDDAFVDALYDDVLGRAPDAPGKDGWLAALRAGRNRAEVARGFLASRESYTNQVDAFYGSHLGREPEPGGRDYWVGALAQGLTLTNMAIGFFTSPEFIEQSHTFSFTRGTYSEPTVVQSQNGVLDVMLHQRRGLAAIAGRQVQDAETYNGQYPGPTLVAYAGDTVRINLMNDLDEPTNLHFHGLHVSPSGTADNVSVTVDPGRSFSYSFQIPANHPGGLFWYHPHRHGTIDEQIYRGLSGMLVVRRHDAATLPKGVTERNLALKNIQLTPDGKVENEAMPEDSLFTLNGQVNPTLTLRPGETQVWNIANLGNDGWYNLELEGHALYLISQDGRPVGMPQRMERLLIAPGARYSVVVQAGNAGTYRFRSSGFHDGTMNWPATTLATVVVQGVPDLPRNIGHQFMQEDRQFEDLRGQAVAARRTLVFGQEEEMGMEHHTRFTINGKSFPNVPEIVAQLDTVEEWTLQNTTGDFHPFHLHTNAFQVIAVNGRPANSMSYQDIANIPPMVNDVPGSLTIRVKFRDFVGSSLYHCHVAHHEDGGMAGVITVQSPGMPPPNPGDPPPGEHGGHG